MFTVLALYLESTFLRSLSLNALLEVDIDVCALVVDSVEGEEAVDGVNDK